MAGRGLLELIDALVTSKPASTKLTPRQVGTAARDVERAASPVSKLPKAGADTMVVRGLPPRQQPKKEDLDPLGYSATKLTRPIEAYDPKVISRNTPMLERVPMSLEPLEGGYLLGLYGDRSSGQGLLSQIGDVELQRTYDLEGGVDFMRGLANQLDRAIWASNPGVMKPLVARAQEVAQETGQPVYGVTMSMAPNALDFAKFTPRVAADLMQQTVTKKAAKQFDDALRKQDGMQSWPGLLSDSLDDWLQAAKPDQQKAFMRFAEQSKTQSEFGLPPDMIGAARYAVTDPTQRGLPSGLGGLGVARFDTDGSGLVDVPQAPHSSYATQATGDYVGSLQVPVPQEVLLRDAFARFYSPDYVNTKGDVGALTRSQATYAAKTQNPVQRIDAQMVDTYGKLLEEAKRLGYIE